MRAFVLCGSERTGGNYLCRLLRLLGLGAPDEYLNQSRRRVLLYQWGVPDADYFPKLWTRCSPGGIFGVKIHWKERGYPYVDPDLRTVLPLPAHRAAWILQTRADLHEQAHSYYSASTMARWHARGLRVAAAADELEMLLAEFAAETLSWRAWFAARHLPYLEIIYEDLAADPIGTLLSVRQWINRPRPTLRPPNLTREATG